MDLNEAYRRYRSNPTENLNVLFECCRHYAYGLAVALGRDAGAVSEAIDAAVSQAWISLGSYKPQPGASFRSGFRAIVKNSLIDHVHRADYRHLAGAI